MIPRSCRTAAFVLSFSVLPFTTLQAEESKKTFIGEGVIKPRSVVMLQFYGNGQRSVDRDKSSEGLKAPKYGEPEFDGKKPHSLWMNLSEGDATENLLIPTATET
ncbi:MAG: hypothetical protein U0996_08355 [Planctomycetaceae bacterium]